MLYTVANINEIIPFVWVTCPKKDLLFPYFNETAAPYSSYAYTLK